MTFYLAMICFIICAATAFLSMIMFSSVILVVGIVLLLVDGHSRDYTRHRGMLR